MIFLLLFVFVIFKKNQESKNSNTSFKLKSRGTDSKKMAVVSLESGPGLWPNGPVPNGPVPNGPVPNGVVCLGPKRPTVSYLYSVGCLCCPYYKQS